MAAARGDTRQQLAAVAETSTTAVDLFGRTVEALRRTMPVDGWCGHTLDPATAMPTGGDTREGYGAELVPRMLEIEYAVGDVNALNGLLHQASPAGTLAEATGGDPWRSPRYRDVVRPSGFEHELRVVLRQNGQPWGAIVLMRGADAPAFSAEELSMLGSLSGTFAEAIRRILLQGYVASGGVPEHPGLVLLGPGHALENVTPEAERWLAALPDTGHGDGPPMSVVALASQAAHRGGTAVRSRARTVGGTWVTLTAWSLGEGRTAVSLESSAPHDLTALALEAYALSAREREVVELVLLGYSTAEIARRLFLSPYTVQDHLKAVFDKTGVRSRRELAADLFFRHYLPRIERGTPLRHDGWFTDP